MSKGTFEHNTQPSVIRELFEYAKKRKQEIGNENVFDFTIGNPNVPTPKEVNEALIELIKNTNPIKLHGYTANSGDPKVKEAVAIHISKTFNTHIDPELVYITSGASPAIVFTIHSLVSCSTDEVIVFAPYFPEYGHYVHYKGGKLVAVKPGNNFIPDFNDFKHKINENTKLVIINSPNNPSGVFYDEEVILKITDILKEKEKEYGHPIYILSDEPYRDLLFANKKYPFITNYYNDSLVAYSYSKSLSLAGERIGYLLVNPKAHDSKGLYTKLIKIGHNLGYVSTSSLFQYLLPKVMDLKVDIDFYKENRDILYKNLTEIGFDVFYPEGAFYMFMKVPNGNSKEFVEKAKKYEIVVVPSDPFGVSGYVRIAYCVDRETIVNSKEAFEKLYRGEWYERYQRTKK